MCLSLVIIILTYFSFYKLAFIAFVCLLMKNSAYIKKKIEPYLIHRDSFKISYKKTFPTLNYLLPAIKIFSIFGLVYTSYLLGNLTHGVFLENVDFSTCKNEVRLIQFMFNIFFITFFLTHLSM